MARHSGPALAMKGAAINSTLVWVRRELGDHVAEQVLSAMPKELAEAYSSARAFSWVPVAAEDAFMRVLARTAWPNDRATTVRRMHQLGGYVASDNLSAIYRVVLSLTSPDGLLALVPRLWSTYFKGVELTDLVRRPSSASYTIRHIGYYMLGAHATGWLDFAYRKVGSRDPQITCVEIDEGLDDATDLHFKMRW